MKKRYTLLAAVCCLSFSSFAQSSGCSGAVDLNMGFNLPAQSTPVDPSISYGCISTAGQHFYYGYLRVCQAGTLTLYCNAAATSGADADIVVWGPFSSATNICSNLTAGNVAGCAATPAGIDSVALGMVSANDIYMVCVAVDSASGQGYLSPGGTAVIDPSCSPALGNCYPSAGMEAICLITVDSATQKYKMTWEELPPNPAVYFEILRYGITGLISIDTVHYTSLSEYIDMNSNPGVVVERYEIVTWDTCGTSWAATGAFAQATFCQASVSTQNTVNVSWSPYYCFGGTPAQYYVVYRGATPATMVPIDSVPAFVNMYNDLAPLSGTSYYKIGVGLTTTCVATRLSSPIVQSWSNNTSVDIVGIAENGVLHADIFPNPSNGLITVSGFGEQTNVSVIDIRGREVGKYTLQAYNATLDLSALESGMYFLLLENEKGVMKKAVTIQR